MCFLHPKDVVDWEKKDDLDCDVLSLAAKHNVLHMIWSMLQKCPFYSHQMSKEEYSVTIRMPIFVSDMCRVSRSPLDSVYFSRRHHAHKVSDIRGYCRVSGHDVVRWRKHKKLGEGAFSKVYLGELPNGCLVAVKCSKNKRYQVIEQEAKKLCTFKHPNIVKWYGYQQGGKLDEIQVFLAVCADSLLSVIKENPNRLTMSVVRKYTRDIPNGLAYLHSKGILDRDIKPENIMLSEYCTAKLTDFNLSRSAVPGRNQHPYIHVSMENEARYKRESLQNLEKMSPEKLLVSLDMKGGTLGYMAPEVYKATVLFTGRRAIFGRWGAR